MHGLPVESLQTSEVGFLRSKIYSEDIVLRQPEVFDYSFSQGAWKSVSVTFTVEPLLYKTLTAKCCTKSFKV